MDDAVAGRVLDLLKQAEKAVAQNDSFHLKTLSEQVIGDVAVFQDEDVLSIAIALYALSKVVEKTSNRSPFQSALKSAIEGLQKRNDQLFRQSVRQLLKNVASEDRKVRAFVSSVIEQAQVKKGCRLCDYGISVGRASHMLGVSRWDLLQYLGKTNTAEQSRETVPTEKRLDVARSLFK